MQELKDIERTVLEKYDNAVDFTIYPPAEQYRQSMADREKNSLTPASL